MAEETKSPKVMLAKTEWRGWIFKYSTWFEVAREQLIAYFQKPFLLEVIFLPT